MLPKSLVVLSLQLGPFRKLVLSARGAEFALQAYYLVAQLPYSGEVGGMGGWKLVVERP